MSIYSASVGASSGSLTITAGSQGARIIKFDISATAPQDGAEFQGVEVTRITGVSGGTPVPVVALEDGGPAALSTAQYGPFTATPGDALGTWAFPVYQLTPVKFPGGISLAPGDQVSFVLNYTPAGTVYLNVWLADSAA
jgi:hypothetical protein